MKAGAHLLDAPPPLPGDVRLMRATANVLLALVVLAAVVAGAAAGVRQPRFALRAIRIEGDVGRLDVADVRSIALPRLSGNFFTLDLGAARRAFEAVPWVQRAEVRRVWPDRLVVRLQEHRAVALWAAEPTGNEAPYADKLVDVDGSVFDADVADVEDDNLPTLSGPAGSAAHVLALADRLRPALETPLGAQVETVALSSRGAWRVSLANGAAIELGRGGDDEVLGRTRRFAATLPQVTAAHGRPLEYADLRHVDGYALRLAGITTGESEPAAHAGAPATGHPQAGARSSAVLVGANHAKGATAAAGHSGGATAQAHRSGPVVTNTPKERPPQHVGALPTTESTL